MCTSNKIKAAEESPENLESVSGIVDRIIFRTEDSGYTVCVLKSREHKDGIVVVGTSAAIWEGETLTAYGNWTRHKIHGYQFKAKRIICTHPNSIEGIKKYLASGLIHGIGSVLAERLVEKFGTETLKVIDQESMRLCRVEGIGEKRRKQIKTAWKEQKIVREIMIFLHGHGVSTAQAIRIHKAYGDDAIALIKENPYRLTADIWGIGFKRADKIAMSLGISPDSLPRARAGIVYILQELTSEGHCYCPKNLLVQMTLQLLTINEDIIQHALEEEVGSDSLIEEDGNIYLASLYRAETGVSFRLNRIKNSPPRQHSIDIEKAIEWAESRMRLKLSDEQIQALRIAMSEKVSIITGGPGVGKTTVIRALVEIFQAKGIALRLAAPTGRATKRMEEATGLQAMTLHRMLKFLPATGNFEHHQRNQLEGEMFILDEVSMIDIVLMNAFLRALPDYARLVLIGDADQLPSVGPGNVLRDSIDSAVIPCTKLITIFRQSQKSWIVRNAHRVNKGASLELPPQNKLSDFYFVQEEDKDLIIKNVIQLITKRIPQRFHLSPKTDIQVLTPMRRFQLGAVNLNAVLQEAINPGDISISRFGRIFRKGDRIMQLRNNYDKDVYNGDIGIIKHVHSEDQEIIVDFDGRLIRYDITELDELDLAYASSIHKAQGHEHPAVVIILSTQHYKLLQRNLLYTALTRGKKLVCVVGSLKAVKIAIRNNRIKHRRTGLKKRLASESA